MIVAVTGGKGGVGKSTVSLNLARELDAVVVDADLSTADLPRGSGPDLHDILAGRAEPMDGVEQVGAVRVLPCGRTLAGARAVELSALPRVVDRIERECGRVVVDCPAGLARDVGTVIDSAHVAVLVTTPNEAALVDALRTRQLALDLETPIAAGILNRVTTTYRDRVAARLDQQLTASTTTIEERPVIAEAQRRWRPIRDHEPSCPDLEAFETASRAIERCERHQSDRIGVL